MEPCELCGGTGYLKSNTMEYEGACHECGDVSVDEGALDKSIDADMEHQRHGV